MDLRQIILVSEIELHVTGMVLVIARICQLQIIRRTLHAVVYHIKRSVRFLCHCRFVSHIISGNFYFRIVLCKNNIIFCIDQIFHFIICKRSVENCNIRNFVFCQTLRKCRFAFCDLRICFIFAVCWSNHFSVKVKFDHSVNFFYSRELMFFTVSRNSFRLACVAVVCFINRLLIIFGCDLHIVKLKRQISFAVNTDFISAFLFCKYHVFWICLDLTCYSKSAVSVDRVFRFCRYSSVFQIIADHSCYDAVFKRIILRAYFWSISDSIFHAVYTYAHCPGIFQFLIQSQFHCTSVGFQFCLCHFVSVYLKHSRFRRTDRLVKFNFCFFSVSFYRKDLRRRFVFLSKLQDQNFLRRKSICHFIAVFKRFVCLMFLISYDNLSVNSSEIFSDADQSVISYFITLCFILRISDRENSLFSVPAGISVNISVIRFSAEHLWFLKNVEIVFDPFCRFRVDLPFIVIKHGVTIIILPECRSSRSEHIQVISHLIICIFDIRSMISIVCSQSVNRVMVIKIFVRKLPLSFI